MSDDTLSFNVNDNRGNDDLNSSLERKNPLSKFSSYTYAITLYMMTPECANAFSETGYLPNNVGATRYAIIAQTGGINNKDEPRGLTYTKELGPNKQGLDLFIDNLQIQTYLGLDNLRTSTVETTINFDVIEPIGFTFLTKLGALSETISSYSRLSPATSPTLYQQHYAIGIKFYGYDNEGNVVKASDIQTEQAINDTYGIYERVIPIIIKSIKFKLTGNSTLYEFESVSLGTQATFGIKRGFIPTQMTLEGANVGDILGDNSPNKKSLINWLNNYQEDLKNKNILKIPNTYNIQWIDNQYYRASVIKNSSLSEYNPNTSVMNNASVSLQSNVKLSINVKSIDTVNKIVTVPANTPILSVIEQVISKSTYISEKLNSKMNEKIEAEASRDTIGKLMWYIIHPVAKVKDRDPLLNDWIYDITYQVIPYEIPYIKSPYVRAKSKYYGPVKKYSYLFTGENTEIINMEMEYNNLYYMVITPTTVPNNTDLTTNGPSPITPNGPVADNSTMVKVNKGGAILENVRANLYSPTDNVVASMKILGDPEFLMTNIGVDISKSTLTNKFFSDNNTINPYHGQLFIEVNFKVAEDYDLNTGLLDVDMGQNVSFYPAKDQKIIGNKGVIYKINSVNSTFSKGKFEQVLEMFLVHPSELILDNSQTQSISDNISDNSYANKELNLFTRNSKPVPPAIVNIDDDASVGYTPGNLNF